MATIYTGSGYGKTYICASVHNINIFPMATTVFKFKLSNWIDLNTVRTTWRQTITDDDQISDVDMETVTLITIAFVC